MKKFLVIVISMLLLTFLASCSNQDKNDKEIDKSKEGKSHNKQENNNKGKNQKQKQKDKQEADKKSKDNKKDNSQNHLKQNENNENANKTDSKEETTHLKGLSAKRIEYARVWNKLGPLKNLNTLKNIYVEKIPKGSKVNPDIKNSARYQEDVTKISAPYRAGGSVTYSSNGDGTINVYTRVPYKWESGEHVDKTKMEEATKDVIYNDVKTVRLKPIDNKFIADLGRSVIIK